MRKMIPEYFDKCHLHFVVWFPLGQNQKLKQSCRLTKNHLQVLFWKTEHNELLEFLIIYLIIFLIIIYLSYAMTHNMHRTLVMIIPVSSIE